MKCLLQSTDYTMNPMGQKRIPCNVASYKGYSDCNLAVVCYFGGKRLLDGKITKHDFDAIHADIDSRVCANFGENQWRKSNQDDAWYRAYLTKILVFSTASKKHVQQFCQKVHRVTLSACHPFAKFRQNRSSFRGYIRINVKKIIAASLLKSFCRQHETRRDTVTDLASQRVDVDVTVDRANSSDWSAYDARPQCQQLADDDATTDQLRHTQYSSALRDVLIV